VRLPAGIIRQEADDQRHRTVEHGRLDRDSRVAVPVGRAVRGQAVRRTGQGDDALLHTDIRGRNSRGQVEGFRVVHFPDHVGGGHAGHADDRTDARLPTAQHVGPVLLDRVHGVVLGDAREPVLSDAERPAGSSREIAQAHPGQG